jgi:hypothetical protein
VKTKVVTAQLRYTAKVLGGKTKEYLELIESGKSGTKTMKNSWRRKINFNQALILFPDDKTASYNCRIQRAGKEVKYQDCFKRCKQRVQFFEIR